MTSLADNCRALLRKDSGREILTAVIGSGVFGYLAWNKSTEGNTFLMAAFLTVATVSLVGVPLRFRSRARGSRLSDEQVVTVARERAARERTTYATTPKERRTLLWIGLTMGALFLVEAVSNGVRNEELRVLDLANDFAIFGVLLHYGYGLLLEDRSTGELRALFPTEPDGAEPTDGRLG